MPKKISLYGILKFTEDSPYFLHGEKERVLKNLTEVHYNYFSVSGTPSTAFESDIDQTGFTIENRWIEEFEVMVSQ